ncbi:thiolase family protein [Leifsonia tongyongensis]|uniref:thiolase family protein n=1 Tax=Leifsonia tongyongensis TaxID=1268043 RepID=UPI001F03DF53|nr:thiolase family protein [Diaminobutyricibacter tongyongensis]
MDNERLATIVAARRTPIATRGGRLAQHPVESLAAAAIRASVDDAGRSVGRELTVADVVIGNCMGPGGNTARVAALAAGLDVAVPGMTVDRQCGSGLSAIVTAAGAIRTGDAEAVVAGGAESASTAPVRMVDGQPYLRAAFAPAGTPDPDMLPAAEALGRRFGIGRELQDAYALRSHRAAERAIRDGRFADELVEVGAAATDDGPRIDLERMLRRFPPLAGGAVTAGNACRVSDGAAAVAIVDDALRGSAPGLRLVASATVGCDPSLPGIGPVGAVERVLAIADVSLDDIAAFEIVEAFAAQSLAVLIALGLHRDDRTDPRICADGGALALGHPWGASGAVSVVRLFSRLVRAGAPAGSLGIATAAVGGGMGVAALFEVVR